jgi:hypothetical protein
VMVGIAFMTGQELSRPASGRIGNEFVTSFGRNDVSDYCTAR